MAATAGGAPEQSQQGRALLQCAVHAIQDGRWDDLTSLLQSHAPALQAARLRLERQALERHAARAQKSVEASDDPPHKPSAAAAAAIRGGLERKAPRAPPAPPAPGVPAAASDEGLAAQAAASLTALARWADRVPLQAILVAQLVVLAAYAPAFTYQGYKMDDTVAIEKNPNVVAEQASLTELLRRDFWGLPMHGSGWTNKSFRPLTTLTFRWNYLLHGLDSSGFFVANVLLHCLTSILVGQMAVDTIGLPGAWAALTSLFFGVHPIHTENVLYLVGRADVLAAVLAAVGASLYSVLYRPPPSLELRVRGLVQKGWASTPFWLILPLAAIVASGLCKETGFTLFALFMLMELLDLTDAQSAARRSGQRAPAWQWRRTRLRAGLLCLATFSVFVMRYRHTGGTKLNMSPQDNPISFESERLVRVLSYAYLHGVYAKLLWWPQFLCYDYSMDAIPAVRTPLDCRLLLPLAAYVAALGSVSCALSAPRRYRRAALLSLALLALPFLPASNILFPVGTVIGERLLYMPSMGFCLAVAVWLHASLARASRRRATAATVIGGVVLVLLTVRTFVRVRVWETSETLFINDGHIQPKSSKVQFNLGITYMQLQDWDSAVEALVRCAWADPLSSLPFYRIGQIEILRGRYETAEKYLSAAIDKFGASLMVRDEEVFHDLAVAMFQNGKADMAETRLRVALQLNPEFAKGWNNLACCIVARDLHDSARALRKAVSLAPENPQYWANLALLARHTGDPATASGAWRRAQELWPGMPEPRDCTWEFAPAG